MKDVSIGIVPKWLF